MEIIYEIFSQSQPFTSVIFVNRISNWNDHLPRKKQQLTHRIHSRLNRENKKKKKGKIIFKIFGKNVGAARFILRQIKEFESHNKHNINSRIISTFDSSSQTELSQNKKHIRRR